MKKTFSAKKLAITAGIAVALSAGTVGVALAQTSTGQPTTTAQKAIGTPNPQGTAFEGLTYGPPATKAGENDPELIAVLINGNKLGYVKRDELRREQGHPSMFKSPKKRWHGRRQPKESQAR
ncbi:hypothetical protein [Arthrobacter sp. MMS18-M83]|uniref:hypothetical protein n=1 Tax=Arthrobacter sp. MMS18-M83 TaxID=2996261 RepID=UPI00227BD098|nr:hypothetical protein [Arthrobacter sp. MMS18-M83]WAH98840.1 hypothetical protein OW521_08420 [Arthrobacter sp. MMS18-M83]